VNSGPGVWPVQAERASAPTSNLSTDLAWRLILGWHRAGHIVCATLRVWLALLLLTA
jgi:hypothetical protein